ncbi:hypothetical protein BGZ54_006964 [Gamsiella multidivaricata]|nr:hypothetical protein BGZ54_006964 [Gamsiella multidivaricata]
MLVNMYFMTPCLLFSKIASAINWTQFKAFWPIPVFYVFFSAVSWIVAKAGSRLFRFSKDEEKFVTASVLFSNTNSLPMALLMSLAYSGAGDRLMRDENDTSEDVAARGISYILFYAIFGNLVRWSYGFTLLVPQDKKREPEEASDRSLPAPSVLINVDMPPSKRGQSSMLTAPASDQASSSSHHSDTDESDPTANPRLNKSLAAPPTCSLTYLAVPPRLRSPAISAKSISESILMKTATTTYERVRQVMTPPLVTALVALFIGLVPALHHLFMSPQSIVYRFLIRPIESCGASAIPMILLCLGAQVVYFASSSSSSNSAPSAPMKSQRPRAESPPARTELGIYSKAQDDEDQRRTGGFPAQSNETYGQGIASARSNASSSATLLHFNHPETNLQSTPRYGSVPLTASDASDNYDGNDDDSDEDQDEALPLLKSSPESASQPHYRIRWITPIPFILFTRLLLIPVVCLPAVIFHPESLSPILATDPTFSLALILIMAAPTAINLTQQCSIKGFFEKEMASVLFWSYCVFGIPCILGWSLVGLWAAGRE